jgi:cyanophycinase
VPGPIALVGSGEFTPALEPVDRMLLAAIGRKRPRVAILPTASAPDGPEVFARWGRMGRDHFQELGCEVEVVPVAHAAEAHDVSHVQAIGEADLVYLSGGNPDHLFEVLHDSPLATALREAWARGAVIAGCSAGAMVLAEHRLRSMGASWMPVRWGDGLGLVPGVAVAPHYDRFPETLLVPLVLTSPRETRVLGIDEETALVGKGDSWEVHGPGRVTVWRGRHRDRYREGDVIRL